MCKNYIVPITNKGNNTLDTPPLTKCIKSYLPILIHTVDKCIDFLNTVKITIHNFILEMHYFYLKIHKSF